MKRTADLEDKALQRILRSDFLQNGYIFFSGFLHQAEISKVKVRASYFISDKVEDMPPERVYYESKIDRSSLKQFQQLFVYGRFFHGIMFHSRFEKLASMLLDDQVIGRSLPYFNKPPKIGKPTPAALTEEKVWIEVWDKSNTPDRKLTFMRFRPIEIDNQ